jgi:hypothetical protein
MMMWKFRNIGTPEAREKLRYRLGEQTFILIPGGQELYVGTPHTHDSLYTEIMLNPDSKCLVFKMFEKRKDLNKLFKSLLILNLFMFLAVLVDNQNYSLRIKTTK